MSGLWRGWISLEGGNGLYTGSFSLWNGDSGLIDDPVEGAAPVLTAPTLTLTSDVGRRPVTWNSSADDTIFAGYVYRLQVATNSDRTGIVQDISHDIVGGELNGASSSYDLSGDGYSEPPVGTHYYFARYERDDGEVSAWAGPMTVVVYDFAPTAFSFTDETGLALSTLETSNSITVLGVSAAAVCNWTVTGSGFEAQVNGAGAWATSGTCELNDTIQLRGTTSATNSTALNGVLDIEGVTDTWTITTVASSLVDGTQGSANSAFFAGVYFTVSGGVVSSITGKNKNIASVTRMATGVYRFAFTTPPSNDEFGIIAGGLHADTGTGAGYAFYASPGRNSSGSNSFSTTQVDVYVKQAGGTALVDPTRMGIVFYDPSAVGSDYLAAVSFLTDSPVYTTYTIEQQTNVSSLTRLDAGVVRVAYTSALAVTTPQIFGWSRFPDWTDNNISSVSLNRNSTIPSDLYSDGEADVTFGQYDAIAANTYDTLRGGILVKRGNSAPRGTVASAVISMDGVGGCTLVEGWNVASVTRLASGVVRVTFDTELSDADYICVGNGKYQSYTGNFSPVVSLNNDDTNGYNGRSVNSADIIVSEVADGSNFDPAYIHVWFIKPWLV